MVYCFRGWPLCECALHALSVAAFRGVGSGKQEADRMSYGRYRRSIVVVALPVLFHAEYHIDLGVSCVGPAYDRSSATSRGLFGVSLICSDDFGRCSFCP